MPVEATGDSIEVLDGNFEQTNRSIEVVWNGRVASLGNISMDHNPDIMPCGAYLGGVYEDSEPPSPFWGYFDGEAKKQNEFDIAVYQYHIRCNNEESKKTLESAFEKMAIGMIGIVVGVVMFPSSPSKSVFMIYNCASKVWQGVEDFKKAMTTSGNSLEEVKFVTWYDDYKRNTDELMKNTILDPWKPLDTSGFEMMDKQYDRKILDSTFNPYGYA